MSVVNICLELDFDNSGLLDSEQIDDNYINVYKPLLTFLYSHPKFPLTISFTGMQFEYLERKRPEVLDILHELTSRDQVEILGGGYYAPILPLLFPVDRSSQIEKLSTTIRKDTGRRPRGMSVFGNIWDSSLITTLNSCGMEYVHLDNTVIPSGKVCFLPLIINEQGKALKVIPLFKNLVPSLTEEPDKWLSRIKKASDKEMKNFSGEGIDVNPIVSISFTLEEFSNFMKSPVFEYISSYSGDDFLFTTPIRYLSTARRFIPSYVPAGMDWTEAQWARRFYQKCENQSRFPLTIHDYLNQYTHTRRLYERVMDISRLVANCRGCDKMRKLSAQEKLWEAQCGFNFINLKSGLPAAAHSRQKAFSLLSEAERYIREAMEFGETCSKYDYDGDGLDEYICRMDNYFAVIALKAGCITDLDLINSSGNYAASLSRYEGFDGYTDNYLRGLFVEHLFDKAEMENYVNDRDGSNGIFSRVQFTERKFNGIRKEIQLEGYGEFSTLAQGVSLRKNYSVSSSGMVVQYILKNKSPLEVRGIFAIEFNFAQTEFGKKSEGGQYSAVFIRGSDRNEIEWGKKLNVEGDVSCLQVQDNINKNTFVFEPNENSGLCCNVITTHRPVEDDKVEVSTNDGKYALYWNVDLNAGMEIEKTINFSVVPAKKKNKRY